MRCPPVPEGEQNNKWLEKMLTLKIRYVHYLSATNVPWWPISLLLVAADGSGSGGRQLPGWMEVEAAVADEERRPRQVELPRRMEAAVARWR